MTTGPYTLHHFLHFADLLEEAQTLSRLTRALRDGLGGRVTGAGAAKTASARRPVDETRDEYPSIERANER